MTNEQFQIFLDRHGADPARWPAGERAAAERLIAHDAGARAVLKAARGLDAALTRHARGRGTEETAAAERVLARLSGPLPRQKLPFWRLVPAVLLDWQFAPAWPRMAALGACAVLGFCVVLSGLDRRIDGMDGAYVMASADLGNIVFAPEPLSGARP
jgi:hypothetical protein